jgi:long-chain acyl-CoA synthetase
VLVKDPRVIERVERIVEEKNTRLQSYSQIKKFSILASDFSQEGGELTPTLKVKRKVVIEKYRDALESLYR